MSGDIPVEGVHHITLVQDANGLKAELACYKFAPEPAKDRCGGYVMQERRDQRGAIGVTNVDGVGILFVAGFGPITSDPPSSRALYRDTLGLPLQNRPEDPDYWHAEKLDGVRHFAVWPLRSAAQSCFGTETWPPDVPIPQAWIEFDVEDVQRASAMMKQRGCTLLVDSRTEPWGQVVTRLLSPEGLLIGITFTPWLR